MRMNIRRLAELAGCSPATVSRVLSGNHGNVPIAPGTCQKVMEICKEHAYEPNIHASRMFSKRSGIIGLVTSGTSVEDVNLSRFVAGVYGKVSLQGLRLMLLASNEKFLAEKEYLSVFRRREVDALIIWGAFGDRTWLDEMAAEKFPFVLASNRVGDHPAAVCDDREGMSALVRQCLAGGAKRFVYVDGADMEISHRRRNGFLQAVKGYGCEVISGDYTIEAGILAADTVSRNLPDAIVCVNDLTAMGVVTGLKKLGVAIPKDVMVTGADGTYFSMHTDPPLSTYDQMARQCGEACFEMLSEFLATGEPMKSRQLSPEIHLRESTFS